MVPVMMVPLGMPGGVMGGGVGGTGVTGGAPAQSSPEHYIAAMAATLAMMAAAGGMPGMPPTMCPMPGENHTARLSSTITT